MKTVVWIFAVVVIAAVGVAAYLAFNSGALMKDGIETYGSQVLGAQVTVSSAALSLRDGEGTVSGLSVAQPVGFEGDSAIEVDSISIRLNVAASTTDVVVMERVVIDGAQVLAIARGAEDNNFQALLDNLQRNTGATKSQGQATPRFIISRFDFTNAKATARLPGSGQAVTLSIPDVRLVDIGRDVGGLTAEELTQAIAAPITAAATRAISKSISNAALEQAQGILKDRLGSSLDKLRELGHPN